VDAKDVLALGRANPDDPGEPFGMTPLGLRLSRTANAVSRKHGDVARDMWRHLAADGPPITYVTNGVHLPTWMSGPIREVLDRYLPGDWTLRASDPAVWQAVDAIPDEDLWAARVRLRKELIDFVRERAAEDRLGRGETLEYVEAAT